MVSSMLLINNGTSRYCARSTSYKFKPLPMFLLFLCSDITTLSNRWRFDTTTHTRKMAKDTSFKACDNNRKKLHSIDCPPVKITSHRMSPDEWKVATKTAAAAVKAGRVTKKRAAKTKAKKVSRRAGDIIRCTSEETECLHCGKLGDDSSVCTQPSIHPIHVLTPFQCGPKCYKQFRKDNFVADRIDIKGPGAIGYAAFTKPGSSIKKGQWLDEYLGDLKPHGGEDGDSSSLYRCKIPNFCVVDAERAGNWTRFINSHCRPNVKLWGETIGKRHVILFQALKDIGPEEEIAFNYGRGYFEKAGFECACDAHKRPHMPGGQKSRR